MSTGPVFVVGTPRAGTTLVAAILGRTPDIFSPGESHFFEDVWARRQAFGPLNTPEQLAAASGRLLTVFGRFNQDTQVLVDRLLNRPVLVERALSLGGGYAGLYLAFMGLLTESQGKVRFCDDTPKHLFFLDRIFEFFPDARVIACVRDPRDFLCSYKHFWRRSRHPQRMRALYHPLLTALLWRSSARVLRRTAGEPRLTWVHYEKLVQAPAVEIRRLCDFVGVAYSEELLSVPAHNSAFVQPAGGIYSTSVGRWRQCLDPAEVWWAQTLTRPDMLAFGYKTVPGRAPFSKLARPQKATPHALWRGLRANNGRRGPLVPYLWRRVAALMGR